MAEKTRQDLAEKRFVTLLLRLVVSAECALVYGEVVSLEDQRLGRFSDWTQLPQVVQRALRGRTGTP